MRIFVGKNIILGLLLGVMFNLTNYCFAKENSQPVKETELTVGMVQKKILAGMTQDAVIEALGSPNIVTKDANGKETWIYDKMSREVVASDSNKYGTLIILGANRNKEEYSSSQKTLTVIIKFNEKCLVDTFSYHSSKF